MKDALDVLRAEIEQTSASHGDLATDLKGKAAQPLNEFVNDQSNVRYLLLCCCFSCVVC